MSDENSAVVNLLTNITRDTGQIKTDLAVNTTKTSAIEEHLKQLNGKVIKQEERLQKVKDDTDKNTTFRENEEKAHRRKNDRLFAFLEKILWAIIPGMAIGVYKIVSYLSDQGVFK